MSPDKAKFKWELWDSKFFFSPRITFLRVVGLYFFFLFLWFKWRIPLKVTSFHGEFSISRQKICSVCLWIDTTTLILEQGSKSRLRMKPRYMYTCINYTFIHVLVFMSQPNAISPHRLLQCVAWDNNLSTAFLFTLSYTTYNWQKHDVLLLYE